MSLFHTKRVRRNSQLPVFQKIQEILKLKEGNGNIFEYPGQSCLTWTESYDRKPVDEMEDPDVNAAIWGMFLNTTPQAAVHLGQDYDQNLRFVKNN